MAELRWIPVSKRLPDIDQFVYVLDVRYGDIGRGYCNGESQRSWDVQWLDNEGPAQVLHTGVTHWMPRAEQRATETLFGRPVVKDAPNAWTDGTIPTPEVLPPPGVPMDAADVRPGVEKVDKLIPAQIDGLLDGLKKKMLSSTGLLVGIQQDLIEGEENGWVTCRPGRWTVRISGYPNMDPNAPGPS